MPLKTNSFVTFISYKDYKEYEIIYKFFIVGVITGNRSIGRLSALGAEGCGFESHFPE